ncbi:hypothetical protein OHA21_38825 [Actinoplanes sp. NBC_00393]|uniref:hypothetical protein n=1 Tax=Actinoplanes sp. NBC_00393 TaxID=2975953 RepID=UPI002E1F6D5C
MVRPTATAPRAQSAHALALDLWPALLADPTHAPQTLATAAVETIGPRAQAWADSIRAAYPQATPESLARLATRRFARSAALRAGLGAVAGPYAPVALLTAAAITHAELVLHLAAAYGKNATDPQRADDLVRLFPKGWLAAWAAVRIADRAWPGLSLATAVLGSRNAIEDAAVRARRLYSEVSQPSQESGSS